MEALSAQDASFLYIEDDFNHMHIAVAAIFEGPAPQGSEIEEMVSSKLELVPRYRQKLHFVPFGLGQPVWADDPRFDLQYHVRHTALPAPGSSVELETLVARVISQRLDRARPLWELWVVEGLEDGCWALISKTHHCMVDGVSGSDLLTVLLDASPDSEHPPGEPWEPAARPSRVGLVASSLRRGLATPREGLQALGRVASAPAQALRELANFSEGLATFRAFSTAELETSLNGPIGAHRRWRTATTSIADIQKIRHAHGGTLNDVVMSAIAQGFRTLLIARGEEIAGRSVRCMVPVSVRRDDERGVLNNRVSSIFVDLPMETGDPVERLHAVQAEMNLLKEHHQAEAAERIGALANHSPPALLALGARLFAHADQHLVQSVTTNVPGPRQPLFAAHRRMLAAYPYVPLFGTVRIGVAIFSYAGQVSFGITGDYESVPDIDVLAAGIEQGIEDLLRAS